MQILILIMTDTNADIYLADGAGIKSELSRKRIEISCTYNRSGFVM